MSTQDKVNTTFHLIKVPTEDELVFWIQQFRTQGSNGHSEWSERYQRNMWISDKELWSGFKFRVLASILESRTMYRISNDVNIIS